VTCAFCGDEATPGFGVGRYPLCRRCRGILAEIVALPPVMVPRFAQTVLSQIRALPEIEEPRH
jgi:hypothetical protein